jgi:hypothetical protein
MWRPIQHEKYLNPAGAGVMQKAAVLQRSRKWFLLVAGALIAAYALVVGGANAPLAPPPSTPGPVSSSSLPQHLLFRADYSNDMLGFPTRKDDPDDWEGTLLPKGCSDGTPAYQLRQLPGNPGDDSGQHYWGHAGVVIPAPRFGETRFVRFRVFYDGKNNFRGRDGGHATNKMLIMNQGCSGRNCRVILNTEQYADWAEPEERLRIHYKLGTDGGAAQIVSPYQDRGVWHHIQLMLRYSSAHDVADGATRMWINNNDFNRPTVENTRVLNIGTGATPNGYTEIGAFNNAPLDRTGSHTWRHCGFEVGTSFDPKWRP